MFRPNTLQTAVIVLLVHSLLCSEFNIYNRRCKVGIKKIDKNAKRLSQLQYERIIDYPDNYLSKPVPQPELEVDYKDHDYYFVNFIDAGGSGEVYLVQDAQTEQPQVYKRFYNQRPEQFRRQNYIMNLMNYSIGWARDCGRKKCPPSPEAFSTISIYPYKQSIVFRKLQFDPQEATLVFYKVLKELDKTHKQGIIHHDMKMGNLMVNSKSADFKFYEVQLIDWNLAAFYYKGYESSTKKGTVCYYSPQQLLRSFIITPATDIWSLAIVMISYITDSKPFSHDCKGDNLRAIVSLVGGQKIIQLAKKNRYSTKINMEFLNQMEENPQKYMPKPLEQMKFRENRDYLVDNKHLIDVFNRMLQPDPQKRATAEELMKMKYFENVSRLPLKYCYHDLKKQKKHIDRNSIKEQTKPTLMQKLIKMADKKSTGRKKSESSKQSKKNRPKNK